VSDIGLKRFVVGPLGTNCYLVWDVLTREACLIDPGGDARSIKSFMAREGLSPRFIINTHGHGDHIGANSAFDLPVYIHRLDADCLTDPVKNLSRVFMGGVVSPKASGFLADGDMVKLGGAELRILYTPGHTRGSVSIAVDGVVFTGDALFAGSIGRTDLEYGDEDLLINSIKDKLLTMKDDVIVYPGHGEPSTIGEEKASNPFLR